MTSTIVLIFKPVKVHILQFMMKIVYTVMLIRETIGYSLELVFALPVVIDVNVIQVTLMRPIVSDLTNPVKLLVISL